MRFTLGLFSVLCLAAGVVSAQPFCFAPDAPAVVDDQLLPTSQLLQNVNGTYVDHLAAALPEKSQIDAAFFQPGSGWLLSFAAGTSISGQDVDPRDVLQYTGGSLLVWLDAAGAGIPAGANVDAVFVDSAGITVVSFDAPTIVGGQLFRPSDLAACGPAGCAIYADLAAAGVPPNARVRAADRWENLIVFSVDVGFRLPGLEARPGDLLAYDVNDGSLSPFYRVKQSAIDWYTNALSLVTSPALEPPELHVDRIPELPNHVQLSWTTSCPTLGETYGVYEGTIGDFDNYSPITCVDQGDDFQEPVLPSGDATFYLVVPHNSSEEGSYGRWAGGERPPGASACAPLQALSAGCPLE